MAALLTAEAGAPGGVVEFGRLGVVEETLQDGGESTGSLKLGDVAGVREDLQAAAGHLGMGGTTVGDRDDRVALAPDDQHRQVLGEVEPIEGGDALTVGADDG